MTSVSRRIDDSGEFSEGSQEIEHNNSGNEGDPADSDYETPGDVSDSENPENEEPGTERRVDDDEDRSNPQYIPKRGTFYEHDDRTADNGEETTNSTSELSAEKEGSEAGTERRRPPRKSDVINKWSHDKFNENEQMPKSRDELVSIYGYDIRNEDAPPHARRNRRYGRGPNKYTRTWEDEEAYKRQTAAQTQPRKPPTAEDFPELDAAKRTPRRPIRPRSISQPDSTESSTPSTPARRPAARARRPLPAIKTGVRATVRTPPARHRPQTRESGDVRNSSDARNNSDARSDRNNDSRSSGDARNDRSNDVRNDARSNDVKNDARSINVRNEARSSDVRNDARSNDVRNDVRSNDVRNDVRSNDVRNDARSNDVRNDVRSGDVRNQKDSGDVRREREKMPQIENLTIAVNNSEGQAQRKVLAPSAQQRPVPTEHAKKKPSLQGPALNTPASLQGKPGPASQAQQKPQQTQPAGPEGRGSKRYSSLRQRPLSEPAYANPAAQPLQQLPPNQQHRYTGPPGGEFPQAAPHNAAAPQPHIMHQQVVRSPAAHAPSPPHQLPPTSQHAQQPAKYEDAKYEVRLGMLEQQQLVQHQVQQAQAQQVQHQMHSLPQQHAIVAGQLQSPPQLTQGYAPPAMMPAQYMQSGSGTVFSGAGMFATPPAPYPATPPAPYPAIPHIYPQHNYATQAGGVTYFNCAEHEAPPPPRATRRPTSAIPIVKPHQPERPANSIENDNIDRIVENMFVRKPWPAHSSSANTTDSKEKSQSERSSSEPPSKEQSQNSLTSSSISTDSKPSESLEREEPKDCVVIETTEVAEPKLPEKLEVDKPEDNTPTEQVQDIQITATAALEA